MLFDCQHFLAKTVHNGALPVHEGCIKDVLLHVDGEIEQTIWNGNMLIA